MATITPERAQAGYGLAHNEGEAFWLLGMLQTVKIGKADTNGSFGLLEMSSPEGSARPGMSTPKRTSGSTCSTEDHGLGRRHAPVPHGGSFAFGPKGVPHTFYAEAGRVSALVGFAPMQFEGFLREVGDPAPERVLPPPMAGHPDMARLASIAKRDGFVILGPPGPPPGR